MYNLITSPNLVNYYTKSQVEPLIYNINLVDYHTEAEIGTVLYTIYPSLTFLVDNFYDKAYLGNQFSLKADVSQLTEFVTTDYSNINYTNSVEISTYYYKKTDIDNMLLSYSTGSYVGYDFYNKTEAGSGKPEGETGQGPGGRRHPRGRPGRSPCPGWRRPASPLPASACGRSGREVRWRGGLETRGRGEAGAASRGSAYPCENLAAHPCGGHACFRGIWESAYAGVAISVASQNISHFCKNRCRPSGALLIPWRHGRPLGDEAQGGMPAGHARAGSEDEHLDGQVGSQAFSSQRLPSSKSPLRTAVSMSAVYVEESASTVPRVGHEAGLPHPSPLASHPRWQEGKREARLQAETLELVEPSRRLVRPLDDPRAACQTRALLR